MSTTHPTIADVVKRQDPNAAIAKIVELQNQKNELYARMPAMESNQGFSNLTTLRTSLSTPGWRKINQNRQPSKTTSAQVTDSVGILEDWNEIDQIAADMNGNSRDWMASEQSSTIEAMVQTISATTFNGNEGLVPESFTGFRERYNNTNAVFGSSENIIVGSGTSSDLCYSIYLIGMGPDAAHFLYPKGMVGGLQVMPEGLVTKESSDGMRKVYRTHYRQCIGLGLRNWQKCGRIANIKVSTLIASGATGDNLVDLMIRLDERVKKESDTTYVWVMNRDCRLWLRLHSLAKASGMVSFDNVAGKRVMHFGDHEILQQDALAATETASALLSVA